MASGGANFELTESVYESEEDITDQLAQQTNLDESDVFDEHAWDYGMQLQHV